MRQRFLAALLAAVLAAVGAARAWQAPVQPPTVRLRATPASHAEPARQSHFPTRSLPAWAQGAIVYGAALPLDGPHALEALTRRLPRIAALGVTVLWLSPVTGAPPGDFGYAVTDAMHVRPTLGTAADLRTLVRTAHALGLRVILDLVVNHLSDQHPFAVDAHRNGAASPYYDWFERDARGRVMHYFDWAHLDNLNYRDPAVRQYMIAVSTHWVRDFGVDGFRVDASWAVRERDPQFWPQWRSALDRIDPDLLLLAEGSATDPYFLAHGFNADYDWTSRIGEWAWSGVFGRTGAPPDLARLRAALLDTDRPGRVLRFLDDNDTGARFLTRHGLAQTKLAVTMLLTLPGLPLIYDGDEVGAAFEPYDGRPIVRRDCCALRAFYSRLGRLRRTTPALRTGGIRLVATDHDDTVLAYVRPGPAAQPDHAVLVVLNWADEDVEVRLGSDPAVRALAARGEARDLLNGGAVRLVRAAAPAAGGASGPAVQAHTPRESVHLTVPAHAGLVLGRASARVSGAAYRAGQLGITVGPSRTH